MVMMDMRYMWSAIDSPFEILNRLQPSRLVVFRRSRRWKNGSGEEEPSSGGWGRAFTTVEECDVSSEKSMPGSTQEYCTMKYGSALTYHLPSCAFQECSDEGGEVEPISDVCKSGVPDCGKGKECGLYREIIKDRGAYLTAKQTKNASGCQNKVQIL